MRSLIVAFLISPALVSAQNATTNTTVTSTTTPSSSCSVDYLFCPVPDDLSMVVEGDLPGCRMSRNANHILNISILGCNISKELSGNGTIVILGTILVPNTTTSDSTNQPAGLFIGDDVFKDQRITCTCNLQLSTTVESLSEVFNETREVDVTGNKFFEPPNLTMFSDAAYQQPLVGGARVQPGATRLYFEVDANEKDRIYLERCTVAPSTNRDDPWVHTLLADNCPAGPLQYTIDAQPTAQNVVRFSTRIFKFVGYQTIAIWCKVVLCVAGETDCGVCARRLAAGGLATRNGTNRAHKSQSFSFQQIVDVHSIEASESPVFSLRRMQEEAPPEPDSATPQAFFNASEVGREAVFLPGVLPGDGELELKFEGEMPVNLSKFVGANLTVINSPAVDDLSTLMNAIQKVTGTWLLKPSAVRVARSFSAFSTMVVELLVDVPLADKEQLARKLANVSAVENERFKSLLVTELTAKSITVPSGFDTQWSANQRRLQQPATTTSTMAPTDGTSSSDKGFPTVAVLASVAGAVLLSGAGFLAFLYFRRKSRQPSGGGGGGGSNV